MAEKWKQIGLSMFFLFFNLFPFLSRDNWEYTAYVKCLQNICVAREPWVTSAYFPSF
jgi:hypothetical protein